MSKSDPKEKKYRWVKIFSSEEEMKNSVAYLRTSSISAFGKKICLVHGTDGFYAVRDKCPHNGYPLSAGYCNEQNTIVCPIHRYHFDLKTGKALSGMATKVETFVIKVFSDGVFLGEEEFNWWPF
ncbi:MAG TPA: Rieske 2Fe-2S domain-containing protein [Bacteroidia bacterium]|jgi:nitrite reductase/ring-hydroxylating ferredoxin subunit|nr:Rieske 2Fe-2S domain-containing protein [Bacteroidia bacterium]